ncbi:MAG: hypothetical protein RR259_10595 [Odoribacter sp.]
MITTNKKTLDYSPFVGYAIALMPLLSVYEIAGVDLGTVTILLALFICEIKHPQMKTVFNPLVLLLAYIAVISPISILSANSLGLVFASEIIIWLRYAKMVLVLASFFLFGMFRLFSFSHAVSAMGVVVLVSTIYIAVQRVLFGFGIIAGNPLAAFSDSGLYAGNVSMLVANGLFRPSAFFLEPSHLAIYYVLYFILLLQYKNSVSLSTVLLVVIGVVCSSSGMGVVMISCLALFWVFIKYRKASGYLVLALVTAVVVLFIFSQTSYFEAVVSRFTTANLDGGGNAIQARIGEGLTAFMGLPLQFQMFGCGYGNVVSTTYINGFTYLINTIGILGTLLFFGVALYSASKKESWKKLFLLVYCLFLFGAQIFTAAYLCFVFAFVFCSSKWNFESFVPLSRVKEGEMVTNER